DVDHADARSTRVRIEHVVEPHRAKHAVLDGDHHAGTALDQVSGRAITEVARVLHVEGDRVGAAQLVTDIFGHHRGLDPELAQPFLHAGLQHLAEIDFGYAQVVVRIALDVRVVS